MGHIKKPTTILVLLCLVFLSCDNSKSLSEQSENDEPNVLKEYIREPINKADQLNEISAERDRKMREQLGE